MLIFEELGTRVAKAWSKCRYDSQALPDIAATELEREPLHQVTTYETIVEWLASTHTLPFQPNVDASFGEPPLTLFWHPAFYIEALFWCSSTTSVHGHGFSGAFQVLAGTSVQSVFEFDAQESKAACRIGHLRQRNVALLRPGDTQMIHPGERFVHSVFHLGYPSVTIVVRNRGGDGLQYEYYRPGVAVRHNLTFDQLTTRLLQVAVLQATLKSPSLLATATRIAQQSDLAASFWLLQRVQPLLYRQHRLDVVSDLILTLASSHGHVPISKLAEALTLERRLHALRRARETIIDDELRLFLALLLTQQERSFVMTQAMAYTQTSAPGEKVADWLTKLGAMGVLNVPSDEATKNLLAGWLDGNPDTSSQSGHMHHNADVVARSIRQLQAEPLLATLLRDI